LGLVVFFFFFLFLLEIEMKRLGDMTLEQVNKALQINAAWANAPGYVREHYDECRAEREQLLAYKRELERKQRHTTPHNATRLGDLWPVGNDMNCYGL
jgi:hypothetical protein